jgi:hypothetical protein
MEGLAEPHNRSSQKKIKTQNIAIRNTPQVKSGPVQHTEIKTEPGNSTMKTQMAATGTMETQMAAPVTMETQMAAPATMDTQMSAPWQSSNIDNIKLEPQPPESVWDVTDAVVKREACPADPGNLSIIPDLSAVQLQELPASQEGTGTRFYTLYKLYVLS